MNNRLIVAAVFLGGVVATGTVGAADTPPQQLTAKKTIDPGPNVFTNHQEPDGASSIIVFSAQDLSYKGHMSMGGLSQMMIAPDGKTAYSVSIYQKRYSYGDIETVLQTFDVATLTPIKEVALPPKTAEVTPFESMVAQSADGKYIYIQNATPATSVTVVDTAAGKVTAEIPTPGCFGIYPSVRGYKFSAICGDGTFASFTLRADAASADRVQSAKVFDVDKDPLFLQSARVNGEIVFLSYNGNVYRLADAGPVVMLLDVRSLTQGIRGGWAPGGYEVFGYNKHNDVLFVGMHPDAKEGSHKQGAKEIWAYSLKAKKLLYRSPVDDVVSMTVSDDAVPVIFALKNKATQRYEADPDAKFVLRKTHERANTVAFNNDVVLRP